MNKEVLDKLFQMLPEGKRKQELLAKYNKLQSKNKERGGNGLHDVFEFKPVGHIKVEAIDDNGEVVGTLVDQKNLVVKGSEEILLRAFSGDPDRILYKNRIPKTNLTNKYLIDKSVLQGQPITDGTKLLHNPNILWAAVNDEDFEVSFGYYPEVVYIKEEAVAEPEKSAFVISKTPASGFVPINAEIYSTYTNMFIGIGDGKNYKVDFSDSRLKLSENLEVVEGVAETKIEGESITFKEKVSNFAIEFEKSNTGAQIDIYINDVLKETIESLDSELTESEVHRFEYDGLNHEIETEVKIVHSGSDNDIEEPVMKIHGLYFDALSKDMNHLMHEFENYRLVFETPTSYNTSSMAPFTIQLPHNPLKEKSVKVVYNDQVFTEVESEDELSDTTFMVDTLHGVLTFNRALTGVLVTYEVTGEIYDVELKNGPQMTADNVTEIKEDQFTVNNEVPSGSIDGDNRVFRVANSNLLDGTVVVRKNSNTLTPNEISNIDLSTGAITLTAAPAVGDTVTVSYKYKTVTTIHKPALRYEAKYDVDADSVKIIDQDGNELTRASNQADFGDGKFLLDSVNKKNIFIAQNKEDGSAIERVEIIYTSSELPGVPTNYKRALIEKPKEVNQYPWFELDRGSVRFVAEFPELVPASNVTIREMGLFDGPRVEDGITGFRNYPVKAFSLVRLGEVVKDVNTGIRITWTITLVNDDGIEFKGGNN